MDVALENLDNFLADGQVDPVHPGILYKRWVIEKKNLKISGVAAQSGISDKMLQRILNGDEPITANAAIGLAEVAGNTPEFWLRSQSIFDLWTERKRRELGPKPSLGL